MRNVSENSQVKRNSLYLTARQVVELTGMSRSTIDRLEKKGEFPKRVSLSTQRIGWSVQEILAWEEMKRLERDKNNDMKLSAPQDHGSTSPQQIS